MKQLLTDLQSGFSLIINTYVLSLSFVASVRNVNEEGLNI